MNDANPGHGYVYRCVSNNSIRYFVVDMFQFLQGGQFLLTLVDYYGTSFVVFILAFFEMTALIWLYGLYSF